MIIIRDTFSDEKPPPVDYAALPLSTLIDAAMAGDAPAEAELRRRFQPPVSAKSLADALSATMGVVGGSEMKVHFDPAEHPRLPKGSEHGGEFTAAQQRIADARAAIQALTSEQRRTLQKKVPASPNARARAKERAAFERALKETLSDAYVPVSADWYAEFLDPMAEFYDDDH